MKHITQTRLGGTKFGRGFANLTVGLAMALIIVGTLVTTHGAGMAFSDWPLSANSLNPEGWWGNVLQRLEHGHRLLAGAVGVCIGGLCAIIWRNYWAVPGAFCAAVLFSALAWFLQFPKEWVVHFGLWPAVVVFIVILIRAQPTSAKGDQEKEASIRWLSLAAFIGVVIQSVFGGMRVWVESAGDARGAMILRVLHGVFAQLEFCLLMAVAVQLRNASEPPQMAPAIRRVAWISFGLILSQLVLGTAMRHMGLGLIIPTFPQASANGSWLPAGGNEWVLLNFSHTRIGMVLVGLSSFVLFYYARLSGFRDMRRLSGALLGLVIFQVILGISIIATGREVVLTTLHVSAGAVILALSFVFALKTFPLDPSPSLVGIQPNPGPA